MSTSLNPVLKQFLLSKGLELDEGQVEPQKDLPYMIVVDESIWVFMRMQRDNSITLFTFVADLKTADPHSIYLMLNESLKMNNFTQGVPVIQYCLDDEGRFLVAYVTIPLANTTQAILDNEFQGLLSAHQVFARLRAKVEGWVSGEQQKAAPNRPTTKPEMSASLAARIKF
ncbi:type III secretion system chaperone [Pokkaliibacter sp. CJK22405]|uniref:type III secretion system chaperone n=1 Tax=Pokkaliibacter sp. CJK22405 TaxID=3384615 RepID=UPI0039852769